MADLGAIANLTTWIMGPARGLNVTAQQRDLPPIISHKNKHRFPDKILIIQSVCGSIFSMRLLLVPSINAYYWQLSGLTMQVLSIAYLMLFASAPSSCAIPKEAGLGLTKCLAETRAYGS
jgi:amino acid transporter